MHTHFLHAGAVEGALEGDWRAVFSTAMTATSHIRALERISYGDSGQVAFLVGKPAPGVHDLLEEVHVEKAVGFRGDHSRKSHWKGREIPGRQVTAIAYEVLRELGLAPDLSGDNLVTKGVDLRALRPGDRLVLGDVVLERSDRAHRPCQLFRSRAGEFAFDTAAAGYRGALFVVLAGGELEIGTEIVVQRAGESNT